MASSPSARARRKSVCVRNSAIEADGRIGPSTKFAPHRQATGVQVPRSPGRPVRPRHPRRRERPARPRFRTAYRDEELGSGGQAETTEREGGARLGAYRRLGEATGGDVVRRPLRLRGIYRRESAAGSPRHGHCEIHSDRTGQLDCLSAINSLFADSQSCTSDP
jgi:hypothetical protein